MALGGVMESRFNQLVDNAVSTRIEKISQQTEPMKSDSELEWERFSPQRLTEITAQQKTVFLDFTADW